MANRRWLLVLLAWVCAITLVHSLDAMTLDYATAAKALAEAAWFDLYFGDVALPVEASKETPGGRSYADAYWHEVQYGGKLDINIAASAKTDPNLIVLTTDLSASFRRESGTDVFFLYFYQLAQATVEGQVTIDEFPPGTPCSLHFEATWPQDTWTGDYYWRLEAASYVERMQCGYDVNGPYGPREGQVTAFAGEPVYVFLGTAAEGLYEIDGGNTLGVGRIQLDVNLTVTRHIADLKPDGFVNFRDFAVFARQWRHSNPTDAEAVQHAAADFDHSGTVDVNDLGWLSYYWLLSPRPPAAKQSQ
jgi:hypothetical protein